MKISTKLLAVPALALALGGATLPALAQEAPGAPPMHGPSPAVMEHLREGRIAFIEKSLALTPEQQPYWQKVADLLRSEPMRPERPAFKNGEHPELSTMLADRSQHMAARAAAQAKLAEALKPLEASLSPEQKDTLRAAFFVSSPGGEHGPGPGPGPMPGMPEHG
ncbi:LTXXQ motif family protein [Arboricoccus pini]|uniref:LTXXQ motif family protein n=1 Tax=Arboricoccus pini TaxID=1963835 RepID=A0A212S064_9PROT|nr:Spy/CpxP family protein refolding chaperone [Arboricoccus pini]SNB78360.1 LTXXQ motif family protein [Arboricoccus pini]